MASIAELDVLERPPRADLEAIAELAAKVCVTPMATINIITDDAQHQVAAYGFPAAICRREDSMCAQVLDADTPIVVTDASLDERFRHNPFVTGVLGSVRFYASHKLTTRDGVDIGTLCVFDDRPRELDDAQTEALGTLAARIVDVLELSLRSRQLAESNQRLQTFAGRVSHDLKTPLTSLSMSLEMVREQLSDGADPAVLEGLLERALRGSARMAAMIDDVLAFATLGGGLQTEEVALDDVLDEAVADLDGRLRGVEVERGPLPAVQADAVQLRAVLQNLLDNAAKYRHPDRPARVVVSAARSAVGWRVSVADNGPGIPEAERGRVFESRVRLDRDADRAGGSGIGLDTARRVVQAHGGAIGISETPGGGATVWFDLPD
ncbi:hypothetical protein GCM10023340_30580 [Nocardioides marinquilinus]|uniref:Sensor-like histidine kinase SenX3 n=1 Tax=Nocardioides marinquilinus TaxID=1210400 RepID=A0ABP9PZC8_9ACTN